MKKETTEKTIAMLDFFGISGAKACEIIGISHSLFRQKKAMSSGNSFNKNEHNKIVEFIKINSKKLKAI